MHGIVAGKINNCKPTAGLIPRPSLRFEPVLFLLWFVLLSLQNVIISICKGRLGQASGCSVALLQQLADALQAATISIASLATADEQPMAMQVSK